MRYKRSRDGRMEINLSKKRMGDKRDKLQESGMEDDDDKRR